MQERRESFRVEDQAAVWLKKTAPEIADQHPIPTIFGQDESLRLLDTLKELEQQSHFQLNKIAELDAHLANYLRTLNQRIELLSHAIIRPSTAGPLNFVEVSLSAEGVSFQYEDIDSDEPLQAGDLVAVKMILEPGHLMLLAYAKVVYISTDTTKRIGLRFFKLPESQRCRLQRHLFERQSSLAKNQDAAPSDAKAALANQPE